MKFCLVTTPFIPADLFLLKLYFVIFFLFSLLPFIIDLNYIMFIMMLARILNGIQLLDKNVEVYMKIEVFINILYFKMNF